MIRLFMNFFSLYRPIIFCFDAEELHFDGTFVFATIGNREGEADQSFNMSQSSAKYVRDFILLK